MGLKMLNLVWSLLAISTLSQAQSTVRGTLLDAETDEPLIGASVYIDEHKTGGITDFEGRFVFRFRQVG